MTRRHAGSIEQFAPTPVSARYRAVRGRAVELAAKLAIEDQVVEPCTEATISRLAALARLLHLSTHPATRQEFLHAATRARARLRRP
jgi:hypothetical protein